ncbi:MAG: cell envelope integrity protein TolA [Legionellaceae bacterium]|nr:cell envelope integrity protein TolA [Legionellaceae bacterium]
MKYDKSYRAALISAVCLHGLLLLALIIHPESSRRPVLQHEAKRDVTPSESKKLEESLKEPKIIHAVSVNSKEVQEAVTRLKTARAEERRVEANRQRKLKNEADAARRLRVKEQQRLQQLKAEQARVAEKRRKALAENKKMLQDMSKQKEAEEKRILAMKQQQAELHKQQKEEAAKLAQLKQEEKEREAREKEQARLDAAREEVAQRARMAGVVDKYKALILGAIGRQWILPDQVNNQLSSRFTIRLAPNGSVLDVNLTRSSGDPILDRSAQAAIYKASPLPVPEDPAAFNLFREITLTVRPENVRG